MVVCCGRRWRQLLTNECVTVCELYALGVKSFGEQRLLALGQIPQDLADLILKPLSLFKLYRVLLVVLPSSFFFLGSFYEGSHQ